MHCYDLESGVLGETFYALFEAFGFCFFIFSHVFHHIKFLFQIFNVEGKMIKKVCRKTYKIYDFNNGWCTNWWPFKLFWVCFRQFYYCQCKTPLEMSKLIVFLSGPIITNDYINWNDAECIKFFSH